MRNLHFVFIFLICVLSTSAQSSALAPELLSAQEVVRLFPGNVRTQLGISYPIFRVYKFADKEGLFYCLLTESRDEIKSNKDTINRNIKAVCAKAVQGAYDKIWEINDNITVDERDEKSIWFWTKYTDFKDYNGDGLSDRIIVYGTSALNGLDDGRIKILIIYKGQKIALRHQNGVLDLARRTQVDRAFYNLPPALQASVKLKMQRMMKAQVAIFPFGWEAAMKKRKTIFSESQ